MQKERVNNTWKGGHKKEGQERMKIRSEEKRNKRYRDGQMEENKDGREREIKDIRKVREKKEIYAGMRVKIRIKGGKDALFMQLLFCHLVLNRFLCLIQFKG